MNLLIAIRSALNRSCQYDFLAPYTHVHFSSRYSWERIMRIINLLNDGAMINANNLSKRFNCSAKTIYRDIQYLRNNVGLKIQFDPIGKIFKMGKPNEDRDQSCASINA